MLFKNSRILGCSAIGRTGQHYCTGFSHAQEKLRVDSETVAVVESPWIDQDDRHQR